MKDRRNMKDSTMKHFNPMALREKYSASNVQRTNPFSSFWADNEWDSRRTDFLDDEPQKKGVDHVALASYRRAISNFVTIVTNQSDIPVIFQSNDNSFTDGKKVVIGSKIDEKNFDPVVGLALHEGSHIKLSDFSFLRNLENNIPQEIYLLGESKGYDKWEIVSHCKNLLNYVEDRRIDYYVFSTSPGYKGYYHSMYDKYFHSKVIDKALLTDEYTSLDWDSYIFRILNLTNKNTRLNVLPDLDKIYNTIFGNGRVKKLNDTAETFDVAIEVVNLIYKNLLDGLESTDEYGDTKNQPASDVKKNKEKYGESPNELSDSELNDLIEAIENNDVGSGDGEPVTLTEAQKKQLNRAIKKQNDFVDGKPSKVGKLSKKDSSIVKTMEEAGVDRVTAGEGMKTEYDYTIGDYVKGKGCQVIVVRKLTQAMIDDNIFPSVVSSYNRYKDTSIIQNGISLGTKLGRKLQVRGESRETKWTRLDSGKIDKRLIAEAGFGNERVFSTSFIDSYSDAFLHISVDASGSMGGDKWINAMTSVISICKAASMIQNLDVVVSLRSTHSNDNRWNSNSTSPLILIAYDSRVDKFSKVKKMFPYLHPGGTTPEGLCFEAIMNDIIPTTNDLDSYFLNFSDGMPMFSSDTISYYDDDAVNHTKKMVNEIRSRGIKVLSYYIGGEYERESTQADFKTMYGKDANFINVKSVVDVSKTMNKKFLEKN
tara:strand:- start:3757 stop:5883 length:2127 start_codon:yes stop_codon:yes gene_type:complete